jgi:hypothetical protein
VVKVVCIGGVGFVIVVNVVCFCVVGFVEGIVVGSVVEGFEVFVKFVCICIVRVVVWVDIIVSLVVVGVFPVTAIVVDITEEKFSFK